MKLSKSQASALVRLRQGPLEKGEIPKVTRMALFGRGLIETCGGVQVGGRIFDMKIQLTPKGIEALAQLAGKDAGL